MSKLVQKMKLLQEYAGENGWFLCLQKLSGAVVHRSRDRLLAAKLKTSGMKLGKHPRLIGLNHIHLGVNFSAGNGFWLEAVTSFAGVNQQPLLIVGTNCNLSDSVHIGCVNRVTIGNNFLCGSHVIISDHNHGIYNSRQTDLVDSDPTIPPVQRPLSNDKSVCIGNNVWVGDGAAILGGAVIGDGVVIGANAVVTGTIPPFTIAVGIPAKPVKQFNFEKQQWIDFANAEPPISPQI
ncbi:MAG TPA: hypothetical protein VFE38_15645 [Edaphobacter sp.]|nr:hypothetical protein [Edaphobacter sp.]